MMDNRSTCIVREISLPEREYRVSPPESWEGCIGGNRRSCGRRRRRRRFRLLPALLALSLVFSFLLGRASASKKQAGTPSVIQARQGEVRPSGDEEAGALPEGLQTAGSGAGTPVSVLPEGLQTADSGAGTPVSVLPEESQTAEWNLVLVNRDHPLSRDYQAPELTRLANGHAIDKRAYPALQEMMDAAKAAGVHPTICSSFRTWETQERLYRNKIARLKSAGWDPAAVEQEAARWVAKPGTSEHQAGLAVDIVDKSYQVLDHKQETTAAQKWLMAHCAEYGFILRYPSDKGEITGVGYEPWHYRYVGVEAAQAIMSQGICLEEYIEGLEKTA